MNTLTSLLCVFACIFQLSLGASVPDNSVVNVRKVLRLILENAEVPVQQRQQVQRILDTSSSDSIVPLSGGGYSSQLQSIPAISMDTSAVVSTTPTVVYDTTGACRGLQPGVDAYRAYSLDSSKYVQCDGELGVVMSCAPGTVWLGDRCDWSYGTKTTLKTLPHRPVQKTAPTGYSNGVPTTPKRVVQEVPTFVPVPVVQQPPRRVVQDVPVPVVTSGYGQQQQLQLPQRVLKDEQPVPIDNTQVANLDTTGACSFNTQGEQGYLPNPLDRSSYIECSGTTGYIMPCSAGLEWDSVNLVCNYPQQQQPQRLTQTVPQSGYGQTPVRMPQRVVQQETAPVPFVPSVPHGYSNQQQRQQQTFVAPPPVPAPAPVSNNGYGQLQQLPPVDLTTSTDFVETRVQVTDSTACVNVDPNVFVQLENRVDPTTFILCSHGTGIVMQCPSGTQWVQQGPTAGTCLLPVDGNSQVQLPVQEIRQPVRLTQNSGYGQQTPAQIPERPVIQQQTPIRRPIMSKPQVSSVPQSGYGQQQLPTLPMESTTTSLRQDTPPVQSVTDSTVCRNVDSQTDTYLSHPVPSLFVKCSSGVGYVMSCPETTTWNPELIACTTTPSVVAPVVPTPQPQPPQRLSIPQQESSYGQQPQPVPVVPQPPQRLSVPQQQQQSNGVGSSSMPSLRQPIVQPVVQPVFEQPQTPVVDTTTSSFSVQIDQTNACASMNLGDNVYLPKLDNPNQFIRCDNRVGYVMTCPNNLVWNTEITSCALSQASEQQQQQQPTRLTAPSGFTQQESSFGQQPQPVPQPIPQPVPVPQPMPQQPQPVPVPVPQPIPQQPQVVPLSYGQQPQQQQLLRQEVAAQMDSTQACARFGPSDDVYIVNSADPSMSTYVRCVGNIGYVMACAPGTLFLGQTSTENPCVAVQTSSGSSSSGYGQQPQPIPQQPQQPQYQPQQPQYQPQQPQQPQYQPQPQQPQQPSYSDYSPAPAASAYNPPAAAPSYAPAYAPAAPSYGGSSAGGYGYGYDIGNECTPGTYTSHPDPRYFYQCDNGKWKTQYCAPGTIWDQIAYVCVHDPVRLQQLVQMTLQGSGNNGGYGQQGGSGYGGY